MPDETTPDEGQLSPSEPSGENAAAPEGAGDDLRKKLDTLEKEKRETYERLLRTAADFDNFRKRARKDTEEARFKSREEVLREMLPVMDNLERALTAAGDAGGPVVEGIRLVLRQFQTALERFEVKPFVSIGETFDPTRHEAIAQVESTDRAPGTVATEMQRGYLMGERLLRAAMVAVAKAPPAPPSDEAGEAGGGAGGEESAGP